MARLESNETNSGLTIVDAEKSTLVHKCVVVEEGRIPALAEITRAAIQGGAFVDNSDDEAGDDYYLVQFPGREQELLADDVLRGRIRGLME